MLVLTIIYTIQIIDIKKQILKYLHLNNKLKEISISNTLKKKKKKKKKFKLKQIDIENHP